MFSNTNEVCSLRKNQLVRVAGMEKVVGLVSSWLFRGVCWVFGFGCGFALFFFVCLFVSLSSVHLRDGTIDFLEVLEEAICMITRLLPEPWIPNVILNQGYLMPEKSGPVSLCFYSF